MIRAKIQKLLRDIIGQEAKIEHPTIHKHGDYSTNIAMVAGLDPDKVVTKINQYLKSDVRCCRIFGKIKVEHGFINFFLSKECLQEQVQEILKKGEKFGRLDIGRNKKVQVEFISANPTGPLTLGNGRGGFCGDVLANVLKKAGYRVEREYYINDRGEQIKKLGHSVIGDEESVYKGDYIDELRKKIKPKQDDDPEKLGEKAAKEILEKTIKVTTDRMGIKYDVWFSEKALYEKKMVDKIIDELKQKGLAYEKEGAWWLRSSRFGDDKDRVLIKSSGEKTYIASDLAYFKNKMERGFDVVINFWGADHHGYVARFKAAVKALGYNEEVWQPILMQLVRLFREGKEVRMSKRKGIYVTLDELIDEVGLDVARFFFLMRSSGSHLNFDLSLAKEQSEKNPVYYVQYAYARISSILAKSKIKNHASLKLKMPTVHTQQIKNQKLNLLGHPSELKLIKQLIRLPEVVEDTAKDYQVQRLPQYVRDVAVAFHQFYRDCKVIAENQELQEARLALILATRIILKNTLDLMGISAPQKM